MRTLSLSKRAEKPAEAQPKTPPCIVEPLQRRMAPPRPRYAGFLTSHSPHRRYYYCQNRTARGFGGRSAEAVICGSRWNFYLAHGRTLPHFTPPEHHAVPIAGGLSAGVAHRKRERHERSRGHHAPAASASVSFSFASGAQAAAAVAQPAACTIQAADGSAQDAASAAWVQAACGPATETCNADAMQEPFAVLQPATGRARTKIAPAAGMAGGMQGPEPAISCAGTSGAAPGPGTRSEERGGVQAAGGGTVAGAEAGSPQAAQFFIFAQGPDEEPSAPLPLSVPVSRAGSLFQQPAARASQAYPAYAVLQPAAGVQAQEGSRTESTGDTAAATLVSGFAWGERGDVAYPDSQKKKARMLKVAQAAEAVPE